MIATVKEKKLGVELDAPRIPATKTAPNIALQPTPGSVRCAPAPWCGWAPALRL